MGLKDRLRDVPIVGTALVVQERYGRDRAGFLAASITYYAFLSIFPLLLLGMSIVGFVLAGDPTARQDLADRLAESLPGLQATIGENLDAFVDARAVTGAVGVLGLLWSGTRLTEAAANALSRVFGFEAYRKLLKRKAWALGATVGLGALALLGLGIGAAVTNLPVEGWVAILVAALGPPVAFAVDLALFAAAYRFLAQGKGPPLRGLLPGAVLAAAGWTVLKIFGSWYAVRTVQGSTAVYGTFASTVGILVILYLAAQIFLYGAELNAVLAERLEGRAKPQDRQRRVA